MKRMLVMAAAAFALAACYPDYVGDYEVVAAGFANYSDVRSIVVGEKMEFSTGVALGGVIDNNEDRKVAFSTDYSLVGSSLLSKMKVHKFIYIQDLMKDVDQLLPLPASMYSLETDGAPGVAVIGKGTHLGKITVKIDSLSFLSETDNLKPKYILPLRIMSAEGCGIMEGLETTCIGVMYEAMLFGNWWHGGSAVVEDAGGQVVEEIDYSMEIPQSDSKVWTLTTSAPYSVTANAIGGELSGSAGLVVLTLGEDGTVDVAPAPGSPYQVEPDGECRYNKAKLLQDRKIYLKYKYVKDGLVYHCTDTLKFRNRIRDGVNEWQDENQDNY